MSKPLRIDAEAEHELAKAQVRYEENAPGLGDDLVDVIDLLLSRIHERPKAFPLAPAIPRALGVRRAVVEGFPFSVVFIELPTELRVLAFAHHRRRPAYWRGRLRRASH